MNQLILVRGLPGSGKSTFVKTITDLVSLSDHEIFHFEADMYFETFNGGKFDPRLLNDAHKWCQSVVHHCMYSIPNPRIIFVSNTFVRKWEMQPYIDMASKYKFRTTILTMNGKFKSVHNVPQATIENMKSKWEEV